MEPYQEMYRVLTASAAKVIEILQDAQQKAEDIYMNAEQPKLEVLTNNSRENPDNEE
jgi:hypothetical protein